MKKILSLIKVSLNHDMNIFKISTKKQSKKSKILFPLILTAYIIFILGFYASFLIDSLKPLNQELALVAMFSLVVTFLTLIEGVYKSSSLLFNCKDDNLLLSLPIKKRSVMFIRIFKFYVFELLYNSIFLLPALVVYAINVEVAWTYYLVSFIALLLLPVVPIVISCLLGFVITSLSSRFKGKNIVQTIFTFIFVLLVMYVSFTANSSSANIGEKIASLSTYITRFYYPVNAYVNLISDFNIINLIIYILIHVALAIFILYILSIFYFKINSGFKKVLIKHSNKNYLIKTHSKLISFMKKEFNKFVSTPVYITNTSFSLVMHIIICLLAVFNYDTIVNTLTSGEAAMSVDTLKQLFPLVAVALISFISFTTSITSSMISLEGKTFALLKSLPVKASSIVLYKVFTAMVIIVPCILLGDIILFIKFEFSIISILIILASSILLPFVAELIGILVNLKYPKMDASNDTEVVKQSMSSFVSVMIGFGLISISFVSLFLLSSIGLNVYLVLVLHTLLYVIIAITLWSLLKNKSEKMFNNISI